MSVIIKMSDLDLVGKRVLIREDLNVPIKGGVVTSDARIRASMVTIKMAINAGAKVILMSHLGRPTEGEFADKFSLAPVATNLSEKIGKEVRLIKNYLDGDFEVTNGEVVLLENVRFNVGEKNNTETLSKKYAALCDIYVMDAFGTAHRAQASTEGVGKFANTACAGSLLSGELEALGKALNNPARPMVAIVGGAKVSTKLTVLESLSTKVDQLVVGGGIANTFILAAGHNVGKSLAEADLIPTCNKLNDIMNGRDAAIPLAGDVVCGKRFAEDAVATTMLVSEVQDDDIIFDIGPNSAAEITEIIKNAGTVVWNGPVGVFEFDQFGAGTKAIAMAIAESSAFSIAGGGDTLAAIDKYNIEDKVSYISTGGGAFLEFLEGKALPAVTMLEQAAAKKA